IDKTLLKNYLNSGNICNDKTFEEIIMTQREEIIKKHAERRSIWYNSDSNKWCTKLGTKKRLVRLKEREDLENAIIEFYLTEEKLTATVNDVFQEWLQYETTHTEHDMKTINEYEGEYKRFLAGTEFASTPIHSVTEMDIVRLLKAIVTGGEKIHRKRYASVKTIIRTLFNFARIHMDIECITVTNILTDIHFPDAAFKANNNDDAKQVFKHSEIIKIKEELKDTENLLELGILLALETGVRVGELCTLKRECLKDDYLIVKYSQHKYKRDGKFQYHIGAPKRGKERTVVLNPDAKKIIQKILSLHDNEWLFPDGTDATQWRKAHCFDGAIRRVCQRLGIAERSMHKLRKTYASYILAQEKAGVTDKIAQVQLGHADISTTQQSYHYDIFDTDEKIKILGSIKIG
ncbi:MAG: tyrosine-type recombinase/integrase, partial [Lachnospiraceae bacterium]|nr:tyrosine-type recombinase/integrase [Lachnospiraceae bacterium]